MTRIWRFRRGASGSAGRWMPSVWDWMPVDQGRLEETPGRVLGPTQGPPSAVPGLRLWNILLHAYSSDLSAPWAASGSAS